MKMRGYKFLRDYHEKSWGHLDKYQLEKLFDDTLIKLPGRFMCQRWQCEDVFAIITTRIKHHKPTSIGGSVVLTTFEHSLHLHKVRDNTLIFTKEFPSDGKNIRLTK